LRRKFTPNWVPQKFDTELDTPFLGADILTEGGGGGVVRGSVSTNGSGRATAAYSDAMVLGSTSATAIGSTSATGIGGGGSTEMSARGMKLYAPPAGSLDAPLDAAAKQEISGKWAMDLAKGNSVEVRRLAYTELLKATDEFSRLCKIGGGGSCDVFRAQVFGLLVAVKRLAADATAWDTKQFEAEMDVLCQGS
jgi:hypothetical protein